MSDWQDSLFNSDKGDSLGDGTWGRRKSADEPALSPVDWDALEAEAKLPKRKVRTRLATPAPGSQAESGLLDINKLAAHINAEKARTAAAPEPKPKPKPATGEVKKAARLATAAKASTGSGLIDVSEIVRQREEEEARAEAVAADGEATGAESSASSSPRGEASPLSAALSSPGMADASTAMDDAIEAPAGNRTMVMAMLVVLTLAVVGLAVYVLTQP